MLTSITGLRDAASKAGLVVATAWMKRLKYGCDHIQAPSYCVSVCAKVFLVKGLTVGFCQRDKTTFGGFITDKFYLWEVRK